MGRIAAAGLAAGLVAAAVVGAAAGVEDAEPADGIREFLFFSTLEGLCADGMPDAAVTSVLERDHRGRYRNFVYGCPVCMPVVEAFRAYAVRREYFFGRKVETPVAPAVAGIVAALSGDDARARGGAVHDLVKRYVKRGVERRRLREDERTVLRNRIEEGRKVGMEAMRSSEGFAHGSCPSCDGAADEEWK